jgi:hypothetical protein
MSNSFENKQNDYSLKQQVVKPLYKFSKLYENAGQRTITTTAAGQVSVFDIPAACVNFGRSILRFNMASVAASGAGTFNWQHHDLISPIVQIQLHTRGGVKLCDVLDLDHYSKIALKSDVKISDVNNTPDTTVNQFGLTRGNLAAGYTPLAADGEANSNYGFQYCTAGGNNGANPVKNNISIPLSQIKNTILALDKDFYFGEVLQLRISWNDSAHKYWYSVLGTDPADTPVTHAGATTITGLQLYLAMETDPYICQGLHAKVESGGLQTIIPYVYSFNNPLTAATRHNISVRLNGSMGRHVKKIYHIPFNGVDGANTRYVCNNDGTNIVSYGTSLDNQRRQEYDITTATFEDWDVIKNMLPDALVTACFNNYRFNWFVLEKFSGEEDDMADVVDSGLPLDVERKWDITLNTSNTAFNHHTFVVVTRALSITREGIMIQ